VWFSEEIVQRALLLGFLHTTVLDEAAVIIVISSKCWTEAFVRNTV
jgi:hypothetical protein